MIPIGSCTSKKLVIPILPVLSLNYSFSQSIINSKLGQMGVYMSKKQMPLNWHWKFQNKLLIQLVYFHVKSQWGLDLPVMIQG